MLWVKSLRCDTKIVGVHNNLTFVIALVMSLIKMLKVSGPSTEPCGMLHETVWNNDSTSFNYTQTCFIGIGF